MLYIFEGPDGVGKSTLSAMFAQKLAERSEGVVRYWAFPGHESGTLGHLVYRLHHEPAAFEISEITSASLQLLHIAAHIDAIESRILPALDSGAAVVLDRFWWSTMVYGIVAGVRDEALHAMIEVEREAWRGVIPTTAFLVERDAPFRLREGERRDDWRRLKHEYDRLAEQESAVHAVTRLPNEDTVESALAAALDDKAPPPSSNNG